MMREDLKRLLDLQSKDAAVIAVDQRIAALGQELAAQDQVLQRAREGLDAARRAVAEAARRRDEMETKIESYRTLQDRRRQRLEHVRNPKEASTLMAELDLARSVMAQEESDWLRSAEAVVQQELKVKAAERNLEEVEAAQAPERAEVAARRLVLDGERAAAVAARDSAASQIERPLRTRYDRLRRSRTSDVVVPLVGGTCGGCHTAVPLNRRSQIRAGMVLEGCEACGAILYPAESDGSG
jgi:predicted  nucleic acid-binding Zn-ribbon protein